MVGVAVGVQRRAAVDALVARVDARDRAQPFQRRRGQPEPLAPRHRLAVLALRLDDDLAAVGHGLADQHLRARVDRLDRVVAGLVERAIELRRLALGLEPGRVVGLVPDRVAVDAALEVLGGGTGEVGVARRVGAPDRDRDLAVARRVGRRRPGQRQLGAHAVRRCRVDCAVDRAPVVVGVERRRRVVGVADPRPLDEDAHPGRVERLRGVVGQRGVALAVDHRVLVGDRDLHAARRVRRGDAPERERDDQRGGKRPGTRERTVMESPEPRTQASCTGSGSAEP